MRSCLESGKTLFPLCKRSSARRVPADPGETLRTFMRSLVTVVGAKSHGKNS